MSNQDVEHDQAQEDALHAEYERLTTAMDALDSGQTIEGFTIGDAPVNAAGIAFPPQMITAIKAQLEARRKQINDQSSPRQAPQTPVSTSGGAGGRPTTQKPASAPPKPSTSHSRGRR